MNTVGKYIYRTRKGKNVTRADLEKETKIKKNFIKAIEEEDWGNLPDYTVVSGFVKRISSALGMDTDKTVAMLRRDYPPRKIAVNPKPDVEQKFRWSPKLTFGLGLIFTVMIVAGYLLYQYSNFTEPPELIVDTPVDGAIITEEVVNVSGVTDSSSTVRVNNQPVFVEENGSFKTDIEVSSETDMIVVRSIARNGQETEETRRIVVQLPE